MLIRIIRSLAGILVLGTTIACDSGATAPGATAATPDMAVVQAPPVSLAWQQKARELATQANMNPLVAARLLAAVGMASLRAVETVDAANAAVAGGPNDNG
jgi:hypothetical protein